VIGSWRSILGGMDTPRFNWKENDAERDLALILAELARLGQFTLESDFPGENEGGARVYSCTLEVAGLERPIQGGKRTTAAQAALACLSVAEITITRQAGEAFKAWEEGSGE